MTKNDHDAEGMLSQETIDAVVELEHAADDDPIVPVGLPGAGKRWSALTGQERELLLATEIDVEDLIGEPTRQVAALLKKATEGDD